MGFYYKRLYTVSEDTEVQCSKYGLYVLIYTKWYSEVKYCQIPTSVESYFLNAVSQNMKFS